MNGVSETDPQGLSPEDYAALCGFLRERTGLSFTEAKRYFVDRRVAARMQAVGRRICAPT